MTLAVDVVIVTYNSRAALEHSIPSAQAIDRIDRLVVVDNGVDGSAERAAEFGADVIRLPANPGFGTAQNRGVERCGAPAVLLLNPDAEVDPAGLAAGLAYLEAHPDVGAVQGVIVNRRTNGPERSQGLELGPIHLVGRALALRHLLGFAPVAEVAARARALRDHVDRVPRAPSEVASLAATALLVRRVAFDSVGGFDERFFLYGEDLDLCRRLRAAGWLLIALPDRWAVHTSGESSSSWFEREWVWWRGTMQFAAYWWGPAAWAGAVVAAVLQWLRFAAARPADTVRSWRGLVGWAFAQRRDGAPRF